VLVLTSKEDVPDIRNSKMVDIIRELSASGIAVQVYDPIADPAHDRRENGIELARDGKGVVIDVKARLDRSKVPANVELGCL
jgi:UDP-N-acetyl-D-galactosamine dehydrogenase